MPLRALSCPGPFLYIFSSAFWPPWCESLCFTMPYLPWQTVTPLTDEAKIFPPLKSHQVLSQKGEANKPVTSSSSSPVSHADLTDFITMTLKIRPCFGLCVFCVPHFTISPTLSPAVSISNMYVTIFLVSVVHACSSAVIPQHPCKSLWGTTEAGLGEREF